MIAHQEPAIVPQLTVEQNLLLGKTAVQRRRRRRRSTVRSPTSPRWASRSNRGRRCPRLSPAQRHALTIAKAFAFGAKIVALDEPTTWMLEHNVEAVLDRVRHLAAERDIGVISSRTRCPRSWRCPTGSSCSATAGSGTSHRLRRRPPRRSCATWSAGSSWTSAAHPVAPDAPVLFTATGVTRPDSPVSNDSPCAPARSSASRDWSAPDGRSSSAHGACRPGMRRHTQSSTGNTSPSTARTGAATPASRSSPKTASARAGAADAGLRQHRAHRGSPTSSAAGRSSARAPDRGVDRARQLVVAPAGQRPVARPPVLRREPAEARHRQVAAARLPGLPLRRTDQGRRRRR